MDFDSKYFFFSRQCDFDLSDDDETALKNRANELLRKYNFSKRVIGQRDNRLMILPKEKACSKIDNVRDLKLAMQMINKELDSVKRKHGEDKTKFK